MDIARADTILKDLVDSTDRMDGHPLQYTAKEFKEAYTEFAKHVTMTQHIMNDIKKLTEASAEMAKASARLRYDITSLYPEFSAAAVAFDMSSLYPIAPIEAAITRDKGVTVDDGIRKGE